MTTREQLETEARELYPHPHRDTTKRVAHVRAKTISPEQVEETTEGRLRHRGYRSRYDIPAHDFAYEVAETADGYRAAGFHVEGDDQ